MEKLMADIVTQIKETGDLSTRKLDSLIAAHNRRFREPTKHFAKKQLAPYYVRIKQEDPALWETWGLNEEQERILLAAIQMKPRRTASGVATITVITKPHPCAGNCIYCPNDVRMPKSYLHDEPACQRAERNYFDPYLQVASRLAALHRMGHATDKIELIVLGGSFTDYPAPYQMWFVHELFQALNDAEEGLDDVGDVFVQEQVSKPRASSLLAHKVQQRMEHYRQAGIQQEEDILGTQATTWQSRIKDGTATYNEAATVLYGPDSPWAKIAKQQEADLEEVFAAQRTNEDTAHRVVGLVVETRPDCITTTSLSLLRQLGCTKLQMGVQTLDERVAKICQRPTPIARIREAFELARAFGFKSHAHFMANLPGATPEGDKHDYHSFIHDPALAPDEVKLYPCVLIPDTGLKKLYQQGTWQPYTEDILMDVLAADVLTTPRHTRISRIIRDFSSHDIAAGNKKTNLRQMVETRVQELVAQGATPPLEIRMREIATDSAEADTLELKEEQYETSNTTEYFLEWVTTQGRIAGFLRLSLPHARWVAEHAGQLPIHQKEAMIREVHVYGAAARLHAPTTGAQHQGLGRMLIERACEIAGAKAYQRINVISAVGTRNYYRKLGFTDSGLYLMRTL